MPAVLKEAAAKWFAVDAPRHGAALAYYTVFSIAPLMLVVAAVVASCRPRS